jgi:hypothetical protein
MGTHNHVTACLRQMVPCSVTVGMHAVGGRGLSTRWVSRAPDEAQGALADSTVPAHHQHTAIGLSGACTSTATAPLLAAGCTCWQCFAACLSLDRRK